MKEKKKIIYFIYTKCQNNHIEKKPISDFLKENKFTMEKDFMFYDFVPSAIRKAEKPIKMAQYLLRKGEY